MGAPRRERGPWHRALHGSAGGAALVGLMALGGCDILDVDPPDVVPPDRLTSPAGLAALRAGALGELALAVAGNGGTTEGQYLLSGLMADEFVHSGTFTSRAEVDRRAVRETNPSLEAVFANLHRARQSLETAADLIAEHAGAGDPRVGELLALAGHTRTLFGEDYCSGVPFSDVVSGRLVPGEPTPTDEVFGGALERFAAALEATGGETEVEWLARVGAGRVLLDLGRWQDAADMVASVPTDFAYLLAFSDESSALENGIHAFAVSYEMWSLADGEAGTGLPYRSAMDPRVPWRRDDDDVGFDLRTPQYDLLRYPSRDAPVPVVTGDEARLIEAEAALQADDVDSFLEELDAVRERYGLAPAEDPGSEEGRVELLFRERALTLIATGHRLGDLRRLVRQYGRPVASVFPGGAYFKGGSYGADVNLPLPFSERSNPLFQGCLDRDP